MRGKSIPMGVLFLGLVSLAVAQTPPPVYVSEEFLVNTVTTGNQRRAAVAGNDDGNFLVVWQSDAAQAGFFDIKGQLFDRVRAPIGSEFQVDQAGANRIAYTPQAAADGSGNYIVVWADFNQTVTDSEIWMRRFDSAGSPLSAAVQVNTFTTGEQRQPRVAANDAGQFVVVWESAGQDGSGYGIVARLYGADGNPTTAEFPVNTYTSGNQTRPAVDMDNDGFTVAFTDQNTGVEARDMGLASLEAPSGGPPQYNVFASPHRNSDVARLASLTNPGGAATPSNTLLIAENPSTARVSGRRYAAGVPGQPFPIANGFNPTMAWTRFTIPPGAPGYTPGGPNVRAGGFISTDVQRPLPTSLPTPAPTPSYRIETQKYWTDANGVPFEIGRPFQDLVDRPAPSIPSGGIADAQGIVASQNSNPARDGNASAVTAVTGGSPNAFEFKPNAPQQVVNPATAQAMGASLGNLTLSAMIISGLLEVTVPLTESPAGGGLTINDGTADYGTVQPGTLSDCQSTGNCYSITANGPRPGTHWDEAVTETLSTGVSKAWLVHIGESFADVPDTNLFYAFIETLLHNGVTAGGACGAYCPLDGVKRQQMAVFLLKSRFGSTFVPPPATGTIFTDVPLSNPFASWIEALFLLGVTGGCSGGPPPAPTQFCPDAIVNRQQMAVFLLKTLEGSQYLPPAAAHIFADVTSGSPFETWIEELYNRQVTGGCATSPLRYCPANPTNRQQMAAFLVKTFSLLLYGP